MKVQAIQEQIENDPIIKYVQELHEYKVEDPLIYEGVAGEPEEWSNIPQLLAKFLITNQHHLKAIIKYNFSRKDEETTAHLREFTEKELETTNGNHSTYTGKNDKNIKEINDSKNKNQEYAQRIDKQFGELKEYLNKMKKDELKDMFKNQNDDVWINDNEQKLENDIKNYDALKDLNDVMVFKPLNDETLKEIIKQDKKEKEGDFSKKKWIRPNHQAYIPNDVEDPLTKSRMFSFKQLYEFNNLYLNKSFLRKRTRNAEEDIFKIQGQIKELQDWRQDIEKRTDARFQDTNERFAKMDKRNRKQLDQNDKEHEEIHSFIAEIDEQIKMLALTDNQQQDQLNSLKESTSLFHESTEKNFESVNTRLTEKCQKLTDRLVILDQETNNSFAAVNKDIERMKFELTDIIESKFEFITRNLDNQTKALKNNYDTLTASLQKTGDDLIESFNEKVQNVKMMSATFFAKIETMVDKNSKETRNVGKQFNQFQANFVNPSKELDGRVFAINQRINQADLSRESQFTYLKDAIKKLVYSLETQNQSNIQQQNLVNLLIKASSKKLGLTPQSFSKDDLLDDLKYIVENVQGKQAGDASVTSLKYNSAQTPNNPFIQHVESVQQIINEGQTPLSNHNKLANSLKASQITLPNINDPNLSIQGSQQNNISSQFLAGSYNASKPILTHQQEEVNQIQYLFAQDSQLFHKRLSLISKKLDEETTLMKPVSKDHTRSNRMGINLEYLDKLEQRGSWERKPFKMERRSVDVKQVKKKKLQANNLHQRKQSQFATVVKNQDLMLEGVTNINHSIQDSGMKGSNTSRTNLIQGVKHANLKMQTSERDMHAQASESHFGIQFRSSERMQKQQVQETAENSQYSSNKRIMGDTAQRIASLQVSISPSKKKKQRESNDRNFNSSLAQTMPYKENTRGPNVENLENQKVDNNFHQLLQQEGNLVTNLSNPKLFNNPIMTPENNIFHKDFKDFGNANVAAATPSSLLKGELSVPTRIQEEQDAEKSNTVHGSHTSGKLSPMLEASRKRDWAEHALIKQTPLSMNKRDQGRDIDEKFLEADSNINHQKAELERRLNERKKSQSRFVPKKNKKQMI